MGKKKEGGKPLSCRLLEGVAHRWAVDCPENIVVPICVRLNTLLDRYSSRVRGPSCHVRGRKCHDRGCLRECGVRSQDCAECVVMQKYMAKNGREV